MYQHIDFSQLGGYPLTQNTLNFIQNSYNEVLKGISRMAGSYVILSGVTQTSPNVYTDGWVAVDGEIVRFVGGTGQANVVVFETNQNEIFKDDSPHVVLYTRQLEFTTGGGIAFTNFKRLSLETLNSTVTLLQTSINTVISTTNNALSVANTAQTTANTAISSSNTAITNANTAISIANSVSANTSINESNLAIPFLTSSLVYGSNTSNPGGPSYGIGFGYRKTARNTIQLKGSLGTVLGHWTNGQTIVTLPSGYRPITRKIFCLTNDPSTNPTSAGVRIYSINIEATGVITIKLLYTNGSGSLDEVIFDGVEFPV
jgi:hypothetical protein